MPRKKRIPVHLLKLDPLNPRQEEPSEELVESVRKTGQADPLIVHKQGKYYLVTGGWQRTQALGKAGIDTAECEVYPDGLSALIQCERTSIQRELTQYQNMKQYVNMYRLLINEQGKTHKQAIQQIAKKTSVGEIWANRYVRVATKLPRLVLVLLKEKRNRTDKEWSQLKFLCHTIRQRKYALGFRKAESLLLRVPHLSDRDKVRLAIEMLSLDRHESKDLLDYVLMYPEITVKQAIKELKHGKDVHFIKVGHLFLSEEVKKNVEKYCADRRISYREFLERFLERKFGKDKE